MSEQSDVVILVVSEETGAISLVFDGKIYYDLSSIEITRKLNDLLERGMRKGEDTVISDISDEGSGEVFLNDNIPIESSTEGERE
jgi:diadenylate cyclase